jgi:CheY-like chemotaxis protein
LREIQGLLSAANGAEDANRRHKIFGELYVGLYSLTSEAERAGLKSVPQLTSATGKVIRKILEKPSLSTPSVVQAITSATTLVEELCDRGVEPDLTDPPVRALVVDDDPLARRAVSNALQLTFEKPETAESGEAAVALAEAKAFDVVFLDVLMPGMDGFAACAKIRESSRNSTTPVVFVTSHDDAASRQKSVTSGGSGFITKPVLPAEIALTALTFALRTRMQAPACDACA